MGFLEKKNPDLLRKDECDLSSNDHEEFTIHFDISKVQSSYETFDEYSRMFCFEVFNQSVTVLIAP